MSFFPFSRIPEWCRERVEIERRALAALKSGAYQVSQLRNGARVDVTENVIAELEAALARLDGDAVASRGG